MAGSAVYPTVPVARSGKFCYFAAEANRENLTHIKAKQQHQR